MAEGSQEKIWSHFQNVSPDSFRDAAPRLDYILRRIRQLSGSKELHILNIGAGNGYLEMEALRLGWQAYSLDPDERTVQRLSSQGIHAKVGYIESIPFKESLFDAAVVSEVLEHLTAGQVAAGVGETRRVLKAGGWRGGQGEYHASSDA